MPVPCLLVSEYRAGTWQLWGTKSQYSFRRDRTGPYGNLTRNLTSKGSRYIQQLWKSIVATTRLVELCRPHLVSGPHFSQLYINLWSPPNNKGMATQPIRDLPAHSRARPFAGVKGLNCIKIRQDAAGFQISGGRK